VKTLPEELAEHLAGGAATLCRCWRVTRRDGAVQGFTDHDGAIAFGGVDFLPAGFVASADVAASGLAVGGVDVEGALSAEGLADADLAAGLYDGAAVDVWIVNWADPAGRLKVRTGTIGEVTRAGGAFRAEVRGLGQRLDEAHGRVFQAACDADLGDARCRADVGGGAFRATATVGAVENGTALTVAGLAGFAANWFTHGRIAVTSGAAAGFVSEIKRHATGEGVVVELWRPPPQAIAPGDTVEVTAGCDKSFRTCRQKFSNADNFQGFPHMPGNAFALGYPPHPSGENDGGAIV
jgi:uncharacterized phage protein (TIGR02218 family)